MIAFAVDVIDLFAVLALRWSGLSMSGWVDSDHSKGVEVELILAVNDLFVVCPTGA